MADISFEETGFSLRMRGGRLEVVLKTDCANTSLSTGRINGRAQCLHLMLYSYSHHHYNGSNDQN